MAGTREIREKRCPNGTRRNKKTGDCEGHLSSKTQKKFQEDFVNILNH